MTEPWLPSSVQLVAGGGYGITLQVDVLAAGQTYEAVTATSCQVTIDAGKAPRWSAGVTLPWPTVDVLNALDPRQPGGVQLRISAGYRYSQTDVDDTHQLCLLQVVSVEKDWEAGTVRLECLSDETVVLDYPLDTALAFTTADRIVAAIQTVVAGAFPGQTLTWQLGDNVQRGALFQVAPQTTGTIGQDRWDLVTDWADSIGAVVYHDGNGLWVIEPAQAVPGSETTARLNVGKRGTISTLVDTLTLDGWANAVMVVYTYTIGSVQKITVAKATTGWTPVRMVTVAKDIAPVDPAGVARTALLRGLRRGHTVVVEAAGYLWTRPGTVMTAGAPDGTTDVLLIETVELDLVDGTMRCSGQAPDAAGSSAVPSITTTQSTVNP